MYFRESLRNPGILNIFTDASIDNDRSLSSPGFVAVTTVDGEDRIVESYTTVLQNSTNNNGEISAISLALNYAAIHKYEYKYINLFADSMLCINTLREWIYAWFKKLKYDPETKERILCTGAGTPVANQSEIIGCLRTIILNDLNICLYHVKGHVTSTDRGLNIGYQTFVKSNNFAPNMITLDDISYLAYYNNMIDSLTTETLCMYFEETKVLEHVVENKIYPGIDMKKYSQLTNSSMLKKKTP